MWASVNLVVPVITFFLYKVRPRKKYWLGLVFTLVGFYFLTANENGLNITNTRMSENSYIYILDELTNETLTVEDMRKAIATMTQEEYPNLCFEDLSKSEDYDMKRYFARERYCDEMKSYLKDLQAEQSMEDIDLEK